MTGWIARTSLVLGCVATTAGAYATTATFQIDVTGCSSFSTGGSCAGFKPSSFQATWNYDDTPPAVPVTSHTDAQGNTTSTSSLQLAATLGKPYPVTATQLAAIGMPQLPLTTSATVTSTRTVTPSGTVITGPNDQITGKLEQEGSLSTFANGVSTRYSYLSNLSAYALVNAPPSPVGGQTLYAFVVSAPFWSFNSLTLVTTYANGVAKTDEVDYYGVAHVIPTPTPSPTSTVPEPETAGLLLAGLALVGGVARRRARTRR